MTLLRRLVYGLAALGALAAWVSYNEQGAASGAEHLCRAIQVGMPATAARDLLAGAADVDHRLTTPDGQLAVFTGAFPFSRYTCAVEFGWVDVRSSTADQAGRVERVIGTRVLHID